MMRRSVISHHTSTIQYQPNGQVLNGNIVDHLIVTTLHEGGVDTTEWLEALAGHSGGEGDGVLFGNTHVEGTLGESSSEDVHAGSPRHGGGDAHNLAMFRRGIDHGVGHNRGEGGSGHLALDLDSCFGVEFGHTVHTIGGGHGGRIAVSLGSLDMQQYGFGRITIPQFFEDGDQILQIMPVNGTNVEEAQLFEEGAAGYKSTGILVNALIHILDI
mmetsp:Transcript_6686/g.11914  ORF Transcript_6686/g.11914 Transcript_6686/m.11914 type:complete len:215 (+) Transcript_6686:850-1494(+)